MSSNTDGQPLVSIGIPVYQGENYLGHTLEAVREQNYPRLEIVISDNASDDRTGEIAAKYAAIDPRVVLITQDQNVGAAENYNRVFVASHGKYFAWNAHDDYASPDFVTRAVEALESDEHAAVGIAQLRRIDGDGEEIGVFEIPEGIFSESAHVRFRAAARTHPVVLVFGLYRREWLERTRLHGKYTGSDRNLVAEMMLHGRATMAGESSFYLREHEDRSVRAHRSSSRWSRFTHPREGWFAPERAGRVVFPSWRRFGGYISAVLRAPLSPAERLRCFLVTGRLLVDDGFKVTKYMLNDVVVALVTLIRRILPDSQHK